MIELRDIHYARIGTQDLDAAEPIHPTLQTDLFVVVSKDSPYNSVDDIVAAPQASPYYPSAAGMSASSSDKIAADITEALSTPELVERYKALGYNRFDMKPDDFAQYIQRETQVWGKVIHDAKLKLD